MSRYIDVDKFAEKICNYQAIDEDAANAMIWLLRTFPTADVVEVRHGEWRIVDSDLGYVEMECSLCGHKHLFYTNQGYPYCPSCGAKMDGERRSENGK
jgi:DNA-directed RNA polymerase subunit RPC12/RpoP